jgi:enamine deaminase RidA (YjgF/YER057c/UK114 family)
MRSSLLASVCISVLVRGANGQNKSTTTTFPAARLAATRGLVFHSAPPGHGTLEAQVADGLRSLEIANAGARLVKLRVFARGAPALDSARSFIARRLSQKGVPLPAISLAGVAAFPDTSQRVQIESTAESDRPENPNGLGFLAGLASPTGERTIAGLGRVAQSGDLPFANITRVTCLYERPDQVASARAAVAASFPNADMTFVQSYVPTPPAIPAIECEAIGRLATRPSVDVEYFNLPGATASPNYSRGARVGAPSLIFASAGTVLDTSARSMEAALEQVKDGVVALGGRLSKVVAGDNYWTTDAARDGLRATRARYFGATVPAATGVFVTGLLPETAVASIELVVLGPGTGSHAEPEKRDTIVLLPGSAAIDGRFLSAHASEVTQTVTRDGAIVQSRHYTIDKRIGVDRGREVYRLRIAGRDDASKLPFSADISIDHRTMALVHRDDRDATGRSTVVDIDGAHVVGAAKTANSERTEPVDFTLEQPAFHSSFLDAAVNATSLHEGAVYRVPTFGLGASQRKVDWHIVRVARRDSVRVNDHFAAAWVVEDALANGGSRTIWLLREPPFFPLEIARLPDGTVVRTEQRLLDVRP